MTTRWFVQSRGPRREHPDYAWRAVGAPDIDSGSRYAREVLEQGWRGYGCLDLIDDESEGALLFDDRGQGLVLLITGLTPAERPTDFLRRPIRVALLGTAGSDDPMAWSELTAVASQALRGGLAENLPITFYDESAERDFEIDAARWSSLVGELRAALPEQVAELPDRTSTQLGPDQAGNRANVAAKLEAVASAGKGPLAGRVILLRTNLLSRREIQDLRPWRAVSDVTDRALVIAEKDSAPGVGGPLENVARDVFKAVTSNARKWGLLLIGVLIVVGVVLTLTRQGGHPVDTTRTVAVADSLPWTATGIQVLAGERLTFRSAGSVRIEVKGNRTMVVTPAGIPRGTGGSRPCPGINAVPAGGANLGGLQCWALTGRIGASGRPFQVAIRASIVAPRSGELYLGLNNWCPCRITGQLTASVHVQVSQ
jgi:hypothetical protein